MLPVPLLHFFPYPRLSHIFFFFFFNDTATTEIYTLSLHDALPISCCGAEPRLLPGLLPGLDLDPADRKSTRLNSSHSQISYAVFCLKKKKKEEINVKYQLYDEPAKGLLQCQGECWRRDMPYESVDS